MSRKTPLTTVIRNKVTMTGRRLTAHKRTLPDFLIIGAAKSGTTSLYNYLVQHACITPCFRKEVHFFDYYYREGVDWYRSFFPVRNRKLRPGCDRMLSGESSPYYLYHPLAPQRAREVVPDARLFVLLRNPVDRAVSHYNHRVRAGKEDLAMEEAFAREPARIAGEAERLASGSVNFSFEHFHHSYLDRGRYAHQLGNWFSHFDREQILVIDSSDLFTRPGEVYRDACAHLGLPAGKLPFFPRYNKGDAGAYTRLDPAMRQKLLSHFRDDNEKLYSLVGKRYGWDQ